MRSPTGETVHAAEESDWTREAEIRPWSSGERSPDESGSMEEAPHGELGEGRGGGGSGLSRSDCSLVSVQAAPGPTAPRRAEEPRARDAPTSGCARPAPAPHQTRVRKQPADQEVEGAGPEG